MIRRIFVICDKQKTNMDREKEQCRICSINTLAKLNKIIIEAAFGIPWSGDLTPEVEIRCFQNEKELYDLYSAINELRGNMILPSVVSKYKTKLAVIYDYIEQSGVIEK